MSRSSTAPDDLSRLHLFDQAVAELGRRRLVAQGLENQFTLCWDHVEGLSLSVSELDEDDLRAFLTDFRKFISPSEPVFLFGIYGILERRLTSDHLRSQLRASRAGWKDAQQGTGMKITFDSTDLTPEYVMDLLINGWVFHTDWKARQEFLRLWPSPLTRFQVNNLIVGATRILWFAGNLVRCALRDQLVA